jgi:hypothetical protein
VQHAQLRVSRGCDGCPSGVGMPGGSDTELAVRSRNTADTRPSSVYVLHAFFRGGASHPRQTRRRELAASSMAPARDPRIHATELGYVRNYGGPENKVFKTGKRKRTNRSKPSPEKRARRSRLFHPFLLFSLSRGGNSAYQLTQCNREPSRDETRAGVRRSQGALGLAYKATFITHNRQP